MLWTSFSDTIVSNDVENEIPVVREAAVFGIPDPRLGELVGSGCSFATERISFRAGTDPSLPAVHGS